MLRAYRNSYNQVIKDVFAAESAYTVGRLDFYALGGDAHMMRRWYCVTKLVKQAAQEVFRDAVALSSYIEKQTK